MFFRVSLIYSISFYGSYASVKLIKICVIEWKYFVFSVGNGEIVCGCTKHRNENILLQYYISHWVLARITRAWSIQSSFEALKPHSSMLRRINDNLFEANPYNVNGHPFINVSSYQHNSTNSQPSRYIFRSPRLSRIDTMESCEFSFGEGCSVSMGLMGTPREGISSQQRCDFRRSNANQPKQTSTAAMENLFNKLTARALGVRLTVFRG